MHLQAGDLLFIDQRGKPGVDHVAIVESVSSTGAIRTVDESTGYVTTYKSWNDFKQAMQQQGMSVEGYGRIEDSLSEINNETGSFDGVEYIDVSTTTNVPISI